LEAAFILNGPIGRSILEAIKWKQLLCGLLRMSSLRWWRRKKSKLPGTIQNWFPQSMSRSS
jgi:hypothetical protein